MSKIRHKKRIMPQTGRMENGSYKPDYWQGREDARSNRYGNDSVVPRCLTARSRDYWQGYYEEYRRRYGIGELPRAQVHDLRQRQETVLIDTIRELGIDVDHLIRQGMTLPALVKFAERYQSEPGFRKEYWKRPKRETARA